MISSKAWWKQDDLIGLSCWQNCQFQADADISNHQRKQMTSRHNFASLIHTFSEGRLVLRRKTCTTKTHFLVIPVVAPQWPVKQSKQKQSQHFQNHTVTLYAIERQTKSVLLSVVKQPPTALLLSHTETISHNDFSASCPGVCLS